MCCLLACISPANIYGRGWGVGITHAKDHEYEFWEICNRALANLYDCLLGLCAWFSIIQTVPCDVGITQQKFCLWLATVSQFFQDCATRFKSLHLLGFFFPRRARNFFFFCRKDPSFYIWWPPSIFLLTSDRV